MAMSAIPRVASRLAIANTQRRTWFRLPDGAGVPSGTVDVRSSIARSAVAGAFIVPLLEKNREQSENHDIQAERGDRWMAEDVPDPQNTQDWPESQDDDQRRRRVGDERREEDAADHQLGKGMHHAACSIAGSAARRAASMTMAAPTSVSRAARMPPSSVASLPASARAASQIPCGSRAESAVLAVATICEPGSAASRAKPVWLSRIAPAWSKHDRASVRTARCCGLPRVAPAS